MEKVRNWLRNWLGIRNMEGGLNEQQQKHKLLVEALGDWNFAELRGRIEDLEAAYPDYKKAKAEADAKKANEIIPGFQPFSRRKRDWERSRMKKPEQK